jgi:hypothetical protein
MSILTVEPMFEESTLLDTLIAQAKGRAPKKIVEEEENDLDEDVAPKKSAKKAPAKDEDDEDDLDDDDDLDADDEDDEWDPDFEEFDLPKSKKGGGKKGEEEEEDVKFEEDEDFKDMDLFNDTGFDDEDEDF